MPDALTVREVAERLGASVQTVRRWLHSGHIRGVLPGGSKLGYRIPRAEVDRLLGQSDSEVLAVTPLRRVEVRGPLSIDVLL